MGMAGHLSVDEIAFFAQRAAQAVGYIAVRWWRSPSDPRFLQIEAHRHDIDPPQSIELRTFVGTNAPKSYGHSS